VMATNPTTTPRLNRSQGGRLCRRLSLGLEFWY
jgi:hypothetical protein